MKKGNKKMNQTYNAKPSFTEWFDPYNVEHIRAYFTLQHTGMFPTDFLPVSIYMEPSWQAILAFKLANCWIDHKLNLPKGE